MILMISLFLVHVGDSKGLIIISLLIAFVVIFYKNVKGQSLFLVHFGDSKVLIIISLFIAFVLIFCKNIKVKVNKSQLNFDFNLSEFEFKVYF
jgi:hypothetical protein